ncbi:hypothetical protein IHC92_11500 [Photobacterium damselae subsp. damselae]|uniref:hypothetical protein n=1 Tax=Photobacterium damselae TaxID=38293 RepID=UPI001F451861|nr:hypothetical protein [Photobacterium damselae]UKA05758.1 hypothetical protein IHC90_11495 [Photobacterium damselae subsp. damselae]UKA20864.1 hypothetical protein IHC92_11500 [Photobacterium damselae subsp. damselae]
MKRQDNVTMLEEILAKRHFNPSQESKRDAQSELDELLSKVDSFAEISGNPDY